MMKTLAVCFARRPGGEVLCLLCGHTPPDAPLAAIPDKQTECASCGRHVGQVARDCIEYWSRTAADVPAIGLTLGELRRRLAGEGGDEAVYFRDRTFGLLRARSVVSGLVQRPAGEAHGSGHVGPYPVTSEKHLQHQGVDLIDAVVISDDTQQWEDSKKQGRYPAIMPSRVWIDTERGE